MSCGENLQVSYYSAILAKALKQGDGDQFTDLYDRICAIATASEVFTAKERAHDTSNLPLPTIVSKISWLEKLGVEPIKYIPEKKLSIKCTTSSKDAISSDDSFMPSEKTGCFDSLDTLDFSGQRSLVDLQNRHKNPNIHITQSSCIDITQTSNSDSLIATTKSGNGNNIDKLSNEISGPASTSKEATIKCIMDKLSSSRANEDVSKCVDFNLKPNSVPNSSQIKMLVDKFQNKSKLKANDKASLLLMDEKSSNEISSTGESGKRKKKKKQKLLDVNATDASNVSSTKTENMQPQNIQSNSRWKDQLESKKVETVDMHNSSGKRKKRTIKDYQREKLIQNPPNMLSIGNADAHRANSCVSKSKAELRKEDEKRKLELLPDETVREILLKCGDLSENDVSNIKQIPSKFDKKKTKKQKKAFKRIVRENKEKALSAEEQHSETMKNQFQNIVHEKPLMKDKHFLLTEKSDNDQNFQHMSNASFNENVAAGDACSISNAKQPHTTRWQNISSFDDLPIRKNSGSCFSSFHDKMKTTLDSTGCSIASTSEDVSSTSSASSNTFQPIIPDQLTSVFVDHNDVIVDMSHGLIEVAVQTETLKKSVSDSSVSAVAKTFIPKGSNDNIVVAEASRVVNTNTKHPTLQSHSKINALQSENIVQELSLAFKPVEKDCKDNTNSKVEKLAFKTMKKSKDENSFSSVPIDLQNKWGLDFFVHDSSQLMDSSKCQITFGNVDESDLQLSATDKCLSFTSCDYRSNVSINNCKNSSLPSNLVRNEPINKDLTHHKNMGHFNVKEATRILMKEWKSALEHGTRYEDL